ncbi:class I SAM-dependent methyltransferase [Rhodospira trueperi]|uniref:Methyltransferase domain-containing protein n=1 Tax=Rhodospira trueperi TaxID=69960 RepID=A0A1G7HHC1_9PROT|nr:class I SAM-dependent methyltransferase [Rhodospira trueperi]SDE99684.1 Methyltransferase domain-containing protein [Rhodospira trueperi]
MKKNINVYGDKTRFLSKGYGIDISSQRFDDLDRAAVSFAAQKRREGIFLDVGCGFPIQSTRFALLDQEVVAIDVSDFSQYIDRVKNLFPEIKLKFLNKKIEDISIDEIGDRVSCFFSQRTMHYLHPKDFVFFFKKIYKILLPDAKIFLSVSGINSELGNKYEGVNVPVQERYAPLSEIMQKKHGVHGPVCLYSIDELKDILESIGYKCEYLYASEFGNIKSVFIRS